MKRSHFRAALAAALLAVPGAAVAQTTAPATATLNIGQVLFIDLTNDAITFPNPGAAEFQAGLVDANEQSTVSFGGNITHDVTIQADAASFTPGGGATFAKPASDLLYDVNGSGTFTAISTTEADIVTAAPPGTDARTVDYRVALDETADEPGTYTLGFTYTIVPN
ncbi:MAG: hypothetical protein RRA92_08100 [Gemmatimonadota bacterium]|nr:hypothetical protein [Gemmatimonadota bacterium]